MFPVSLHSICTRTFGRPTLRVFMKMKVYLVFLFLWFSGLTFGAQATGQDDSSLIMKPKFPESEKTELDSVNDDTSNGEDFLGETQFSNGFTTGRPIPRFRLATRRPFPRFTTGRPFPRFTTGRPFTRFTSSSSFYTPKWFLADRYRRCYKCRIASSLKQCLSGETSFCRYGCFIGKATLRRDGRTFYFAHCLDPSHSCQKTCNEAFKRGIATRCSIRCCRGDLCNGGVNPTLPGPSTQPTQRPTSRRPIVGHEITIRLLRATKNIIEALAILLKSHMKRGKARSYKREIVSMMTRVNFHAQRLEGSRDPEVLRTKHDVSQTRMRAQAVIKKLDELIGDHEDSSEEKKK